MKPYNERLPLIDAAVEKYNGVYPRGLGPALVQVKHNGRWVYAAVDQYSGGGRLICTCQEFEQRARELGWINGHKYGVEYETNGEKPDLPDDVVIECFDGVDWWGGYDDDEGDSLTVGELHFDTSVTQKFRIVDERYRPKLVIEFVADNMKIQTLNGEYENVIDLINEGLNEMNNDWYEKSELPPVGTVVEVMPLWDKVVIVAHHEGKIVFFNERLNKYDYFSNPDKFRPLRTETDKLVDEVLETLKSDYATHLAISDLDLRMCAEVMIEAGYRKVKPMDKDEFVRDALKYFEFEVSQLTLVCDALRKLHSAGCRFIDKGDNDE